MNVETLPFSALMINLISFRGVKPKNPTIKTAINSREFVIYNVNTDVTN